MSLTTALDDMRSATAALGGAVAELAMTVLEDRPAASDTAVVDNLGELVSELQGSVVEAQSELALVTDVRQLPVRLPHIDRAVAACSTRYWRDLRAHAPLARLRATARSRGIEWRTWQRSVEQSQLRCEPYVDRADAAVRSAWGEVGELLSLYIPGAEWPGSSVSTESISPARTGTAPMTIRRSS
jgi:hypothetical protein